MKPCGIEPFLENGDFLSLSQALEPSVSYELIVEKSIIDNIKMFFTIGTKYLNKKYLKIVTCHILNLSNYMKFSPIWDYMKFLAVS